MSSGWQGFAVGFLGLTALEVVVSHASTASNVGGLFGEIGKAAEWFLSPLKPAFSIPAPTAAATQAVAGNPIIQGAESLNPLAELFTQLSNLPA